MAIKIPGIKLLSGVDAKVAAYLFYLLRLPLFQSLYIYSYVILEEVLQQLALRELLQLLFF